MNILHLYYHYSKYPWLQSAIDNFECFEKYSFHQIHYCNIAYGIPRFMAREPYDMIFVHTSIPSILRWVDFSFPKLVNKMKRIIKHPAPKVLFCQDEFFKMRLVTRLIRCLKIDHIFSVAPEDQWDKIYHGVDRNKVSIHSVLTGYLDQNLMSTIQGWPPIERDLDIGYRASHVPAWLGKHGQLKVTIAETVRSAAERRGLNTDIKLASKQTDYIHGLDWYRFLLRCKGVIGVEGGSSLLDVDGSLVSSVNAYAKKHPDASFEEIEEACFPGKDGNLKLYALSPRHLEACLTKTCQILVEGEYNGLLRPHIHYIPLNRDFSNLDEALDTFSDQAKREEIVERAYRDIVETGVATYQGFVDHVFQCLPKTQSPPLSPRFVNLRDRFLKFRTSCELDIACRLPLGIQETLKKVLRGRT